MMWLWLAIAFFAGVVLSLFLFGVLGASKEADAWNEGYHSGLREGFRNGFREALKKRAEWKRLDNDGGLPLS